MALVPSIQLPRYLLSLFRTVPITVQKGLSYPMNTLSSHTANHIRSCPLTYQEYASYLSGNLRYIFHSVRFCIPPCMHSVRLVFLFVYSLWLFFRCDGFWLFGHSPSTSATSSRVKPRCLSALYSDGKNGSGASLNSVRFRY